MTGVLNIVIGAALIVGGLSGKVALLGTNSGEALAALGAVGVGLGVFQMYKARQRRRDK